MKPIEEVIQILRDVSEGLYPEGWRMREGLCNNILSSITPCHAISPMFRSWSQFSGHVMYPVGGHNEYNRRGSKYEGEWGRKRRQLAAHCANYLEEVKLGRRSWKQKD